MTVQQSTQIKGLAIMMMLWLHLFASESVVNEHCVSLFYLFDQPFPVAMRKVCKMCIAIYAFLSGYGLTCIYVTKGSQNLHSLRRVAKLYINYLVIFFIAFGIGCFVKPELFVNAYNFITCLLTLGSSYNGAWWFLFPYIVLALMSGKIIGFLIKLRGKKLVCAILALIALNVLSYVGTDYLLDGDNLIQLLLNDVLDTFIILLPFACGILYSYYHIEKYFTSNRVLIVIAVFVLCAIRTLIGTATLLDTPFILLLIPLIANLQVNSKVLQFLGKHSTNIWLCHFFFISYMANGEIYQLKYPVIIFLALILLSLASSFIVRPIVMSLTKLVKL